MADRKMFSKQATALSVIGEKSGKTHLLQKFTTMRCDDGLGGIGATAPRNL